MTVLAEESASVGPTTSELTNITDAQIDAGLFDTDGYALASGQFTYSIPTATSVWSGYDPGSEPYTNYAALNAAQAADFSAAIALWDSYIAPSFTQVSDANGGGFIRIAFTGDNDPEAYAYAYQGSGVGAQSSSVGDIWVNDTSSTPSSFDFSPGTYGFEALLHEIGHTLGLKHSFETPDIPDPYENRRYTIMSYTDQTDDTLISFVGTPGGRLYSTLSYVNPQTPMVLDIQAVQDLYGADPNTNAGDTVYRFTDNDWTTVRSIYDAGGNDTFDLSAVTRGSLVDLNPGAYSSIAPWSIQGQEAYWTAQFSSSYASFIDNQFDQTSYTGHDNLGLSFSTTIENAIGSFGDDTIIGNAAANHIDGGAGNDILSGGAGADVLTGGAGIDTFSDTAADFNGDTVTDMAVGEYFVLTDGAGTGGTYYLPYDRATSTLSLGYHGASQVHVVVNPSSYFGEIEANSTGIDRLYAHNAHLDDFTHDLQSDLLFRNGAGTIGIDRVTGEDFGPGTPYFVDASATIDTPASVWSVQGALDFNGDLSSDLLWHNSVTGQIAVWDDAPQFGSGFNETTYLSGSVSLDWQVAAIADVNDDGRDDVVWRKADGTVTTWLSTGTAFDTSTGLTGVSNSWHIQGAADLNGDGFADLVWRNDNGQLTTWLSDGSSFSTNTPVLSVDKSWHADAVADLTGDGYADLLWRNDNGAISVWSGSANGFIQNSYYHAPIGNDWHIADTGDYNGDGKADILWQNDNGTISIWQSTGAGSAAGFIEGVYTDGSIAQGDTIVTTHHDII